ncbi:hypothetical protein LVD17_02320 [Fulvivirga ulvae]|uniref:hypothetical protein n=1 Tax=Fulvivirga ulvae TaxID=2904245 RepID=UPI001F1B0E9E|nr:hypothetical protein [Fulvivirga ulvae]UII32669.1 hypothetical protein LVD17_02320 [Fulvivirga ulvae]
MQNYIHKRGDIEIYTLTAHVIIIPYLYNINEKAMEDLAVRKNSLKFMVEVSCRQDQVKYVVTRYIEANHDYEMDHNAYLAKHDIVEYKGKLCNCHQLIHGTVDFLQQKIENRVNRETRKLHLKRDFSSKL